MKTILKAKLKASSMGKILSQQYRAVLIMGEDDPVVSIEQHFRKSDTWGGCGQWALSTLSEALTDTLYIDWGQRWLIDSGMVEAITEAMMIVDNAPIGNDPIGSTSEERIHSVVHNHVVVAGHTDGDETEHFFYESVSMYQAEEMAIKEMSEQLLGDLDYITIEQVEAAGVVYVDNIMTSQSPITIA